MTVIATNVAALRSQNAGRMAEGSLAKAMERLSTGKRINNAADDAAGLSIATRMTSEIRGLNMAVRNANDGISLAQTAEGGMNEIVNNLQRMRELAVQASNGTLAASDRDNLQVEVDALIEQIGDIATETKFNGVSLLDATKTIKIQTGSNATENIELSMTNVDATALNVAGLTIAGDGTQAEAALATITSAIDTVTTAQAALGAGQNQLQASVSSLTNRATNLSESRSRIEDADFSAESTALAKAQILNQASTAMLAQANQSQQGVMSLLR